MKKAILATKIGMTQIFKEDGTLIPVTVLEAQPNVVTQVKTAENDGYEAVQVATVDAVDRVKTVDKNGKVEVAHRHGVNRAEKGHFEKAGVSSKKYVKEFRFGKGFLSAIQKGQHRGPMGHGSKFHRHQGSNGTSSTPSRVFKGKGMPGHAGSVQVTVRNLEIVSVDADKNIILVKGAVPGPKKGLVTIKETTKVEA